MVRSTVRSHKGFRGDFEPVKVQAIVRHDSDGVVDAAKSQQLTDPPSSTDRHVTGRLQVHRCAPVFSAARAGAVDDAPDVGFSDDVTWRLVTGLVEVDARTLN